MKRFWLSLSGICGKRLKLYDGRGISGVPWELRLDE